MLGSTIGRPPLHPNGIKMFSLHRAVTITLAKVKPTNQPLNWQGEDPFIAQNLFSSLIEFGTTFHRQRN